MYDNELDYERIKSNRKKRRLKNRIFALGIIIILILSLGLRSLIEGRGHAPGDIFEGVYWILFLIERVNFILILLLFMLISKEIIILFLEWYQKKSGSQYKAKIVLIFLILAIVPSAFTIFISVRILSASINQWFDIDIKKNIQYSQMIADEYIEAKKTILSNISAEISTLVLKDLDNKEIVRNNLNKLEIFDKYPDFIMGVSLLFDRKEIFSNIHDETVREYIRNRSFNGPDSIERNKIISEDLTYILNKDVISTDPLIILISYNGLQQNVSNLLDNIYLYSSEFEQRAILQDSIENYYFYSLMLMSTMIIFMAIWLGLHFSREITVPIINLIEGTKKLAKGEFSFEIEKHSGQEIGLLVDSFNSMVRDIKQSRDGLEKANLSLVQKKDELQSKTMFIELLIQSISAGIIAISMDFKVITVNKAFCSLFCLDADDIIKKPIFEIFSKEYDLLLDIITDTAKLNKNEIYKTLTININNTNKTIRVISQFLSGGISHSKHILMLVEDISDIIRAEKLTAWKEVAKRIAHEIKNPLTPLQLSVQRICRTMLKNEDFQAHYDFFRENRVIIESSIKTIKHLVNEFHKFARLPSITPIRDDINSLLTELYNFYNNQHLKIKFHLDLKEDLPQILLDRDIMKRALINIINNSIEAIEDEGQISIVSLFDNDIDCVAVEIIDNGTGLKKEQKENLFMPYFSTKKHKSGTGLGLSIVLSIVSDHKAFIRVRDNKPKGCIFRIEFPYIKD